MIETEYILEVNAARGCTNACLHCNHASIKFTERYFIAPEVLARDLDALRGLLRVRMLIVQGGEPLLHPKVEDLIRLCWESSIGAQVGLLTNGKLLRGMGPAFASVLGECKAELRISVYPDLDSSVVTHAIEVSRKYGFTVAAHTIASFKAIFQKGDGSSYHGCGWNRCLTVHEGRLYLCPVSAFVEPREEGLKLEGLTEPELAAFLSRTTPLKTCTVCAGTHAPDVPWSQARTADEWSQRSGLTTG